jgi:hypothetical protein
MNSSLNAWSSHLLRIEERYEQKIGVNDDLFAFTGQVNEGVQESWDLVVKDFADLNGRAFLGELCEWQDHSLLYGNLEVKFRYPVQNAIGTENRAAVIIIDRMEGIALSRIWAFPRIDQGKFLWFISADGGRLRRVPPDHGVAVFLLDHIVKLLRTAEPAENP